MSATGEVSDFPDKRPPTRRVDVLLVDDQPANLLALEAILESLGANLVKAHSGEDALRLCLDHDYAVILLDVRMPGIDGYETARLLRQREKSKRTPIIFVTAHETTEAVILQAYREGAADHLVKPLVPDVLRAKVAAFVARHEQTEQARLESERRFRTLARHAPVGIFQTDAQGNCLFVNERWCDLAGLSAQEAEGLGWVRALHPEDRQRIDRAWYNAAQGGREFHEEYRFQTTQGKVAWVQGSAVALRNDAGEIAGYLGTVTDITDRKKAEEGREKFAFLVENSPDFIAICDLNLTPFFMNRAGLRLVGLESLEHARCVPVQEFFFPEDREFITEGFFPQVLREGHGQVEVRFRHFQTGEPIWMAYSVVVMKDSAGQAYGLATISRDITDRKHAEEALRESEENLRQMADNIPQLAWMTRPDGHIFWYNRRWYEYTGTTLEQMEGWGWQSVHDPEELPRVLEKFKSSIAQGEPWEDTFPLRRHDGAMRWHLSRAMPIKDEQGRVLRWFGTNTDITEQRNLEQTLQEANRLKDEFLAMLAHELRNPLAPIRNALQIMKQPGADGTMLQQVRDMAERQVQHMARLLDDLLDVARLSRGRIELRKGAVDVAAVIKRTVEAVRPLIEERRHELTVSLPAGPLRVQADPTRLEQMLMNLLNNAAKYTDPGGHIWLTAQRESGEVVLRVRDNGIGIVPEMLPKIFDLFVQAERRLERSQGGVGIGLTLVRRLVELHGGTVEAHSPGLGQGSEFVVRLPATADAQDGVSKRASSKTTDAEMSSRRILVVDDNQDAADSLALLLRLAGQDVRVAYDGPAALALAPEFRPAMALLDIGMPGMDGYELARRLRQQADPDGLVLVALTGWGQEEDRRRSAEAGFNRHLVKPVEPKALEDLLIGLPQRP